MYWQAFRAAPEALLVLDASGVVRLASSAAETLFGRDPAALFGSTTAELFAVAPVFGAADGAVPAVIRRPGGETLPVDVQVRTLEGDPSGMLSLAVEERGSTVRAGLEQRIARLTLTGQEQGELLGDVIVTQERERARIAAGVHDDSLQVITAATLRLQHLRRRLHDPSDLAILDRLEDSLVQAAARLRRLIFDFRPPRLADDGLAAAVSDLLDDLADEHSIVVRVQSLLRAEPALPTRLLLFRMLQEAVANVGKHAGADRCTVILGEEDGGYLVRVIDDGVGAENLHTDPGHLGLLLMRERAALAGGWFRISSLPGRGTTVTFWVPRGADLESKGAGP
ncbi:PAS domain-containing protein [Dactylosporangium vinaceum]|uniref:ATP-binding protein n=1 Tax=Dactylosporangium vinaceum TaxID=53362 RepID=A0ABV5LZS5_9ACTN|nr:ATP-binding protein [Dactylosporangium vinaceum]UAB94684.1 PAS domain-containing protein [Dactylosporangium vinaceum]